MDSPPLQKRSQREVSQKTVFPKEEEDAMERPRKEEVRRGLWATKLEPSFSAKELPPRYFSIPGCRDSRTRQKEERPGRGEIQGNTKPWPPTHQA
jgi:hypothetical protein